MKLLNNENLSVGDITEIMLERRALPIGKTQFEEWSNRIIAGALVEASTRSQKWALAEMMMHLSPTEAFKEDAHFILRLRKAAVNETAHAMMLEIKNQQEEEKKLAEATADHSEAMDGAVLEKKKL